MQENFGHYSVLLDETVDGLNIKENGIYVDCTLGGAGHSNAILKRLGESGRLIGIDQDSYALGKAAERLAPYEGRYVLLKGNFADAAELIMSAGFEHIDGVVADLGVSSFQLDNADRGFSYMQDAPLDMRMDNDAALSAYNIVNEYEERELSRIIDMYGEERFARKIASNICKARAEKPIETTFELAEIIKSSIPAKNRKDGPHPAKRTFQAIRIEVNGELDAIEPLIKSAAKSLVSSGRIAIISFHSLEDRIVKQSYRSLASGCTCPRDFPVCVCNRKPLIKELTKKPILPSDTELSENPRSRSAKLRIAEKI